MDSTTSGVDRYRIAENQFDHYPLVEIGQDGLWGSVIEAMQQDEDGILWVATQGGGLNRLNPSNGEVLHFMPRGKRPKKPAQPGCLRSGIGWQWRPLAGN